MKTWTILLVVVVLAAAAVYYSGVFSGGGAGTPLGGLGGLLSQRNAPLESAAARAEAFGAQHAQDLVSYTHPGLGYSVSYPVGYLASADPSDDVSFQAIANSPVSSAEALEVRVSERDFTDKDFDDVVDALNAGDLVSRYSGVLAGKRVYVYTVKQKFLANEVVFLKTAVYPECKAKDGTRYTAVVTAAIPDALAQDLDLADYVIYSFKC